MGGALGSRFAGAGHAVFFSYSRNRSKLERLARRTGPLAKVAEPRDAVAEAQVVLLAVHWKQMPSVMKAAGSLAGKILIDCTNPMNASDDALVVGLKTSGGETIARRARDARVVKAFNTVPAELIRAGAESLASRPGVCYCGDHAAAKRTVARLIRDIGFEPVHCGALASARYLEPFALIIAELAYNQRQRPELGVRFMRPGRR